MNGQEQRKDEFSFLEKFADDKLNDYLVNGF